MADVEQPQPQPLDDADERDITSEEEWEAAIGSPDALCLARGGYFQDGILRRTGRCVYQLSHTEDPEGKDRHSWDD